MNFKLVSHELLWCSAEASHPIFTRAALCRMLIDANIVDSNGDLFYHGALDIFDSLCGGSWPEVSEDYRKRGANMFQTPTNRLQLQGILAVLVNHVLSVGVGCQQHMGDIFESSPFGCLSCTLEFPLSAV